MDIYKIRNDHLINMINSLTKEIENDYFIPQMLVHHKSAEFIPERINELFHDLLDEEYQEFYEQTKTSIEELYNENKSNKTILNQDRFSNSRIINRAKMENKNIKMEFDSNNQKLQSLKQISKTILNEYETRINKYETSISNITKKSSRIRNDIQKLQSLCLSGRNFYEESLNSQLLELRHAFKKIIKQVNCYATDYQIVQTISKSKLKKLVKEYQSQNSVFSDSFGQVLQLFDADQSESEMDVQSLVSSYIQQIHRPMIINDKGIRNDRIALSIEKYLKQMNDEIQAEIMRIQEREVEFTQKIESLQMKKSVSPRNLRAIYASRQRKRFPIPNSDEFNFRNE